MPAPAALKLNNPSGFTLLETMIAIGVILVGLLSIITLAGNSIIASRLTSQEFIASVLAQEGIELVREIRDSNWLAYDSGLATAWNAGLVGVGQDYTATITRYPTPQLQFAPVSSFSTICSSESSPYPCSRVWLGSDQTYFQAAAVVTSDTTDSNYSRLLTLFPICRSATYPTSETTLTADAEICPSGTTQVGIHVRVTVRYAVGDGTHDTVLDTSLYDWKY